MGGGPYCGVYGMYDDQSYILGEIEIKVVEGYFGRLGKLFGVSIRRTSLVLSLANCC